jgi:hypothetical protein
MRNLENNLNDKIKFLQKFCIIVSSVADPDPYVFGPPGSGSVNQIQRYGSGSGWTRSFYHQGKLVSKTLIPTVL